VSWLGHGEGLFFGKYGSILSAGAFKPRGQQSDSSCSIELWLEPKRVDNSGTVLAFYRPETRVVPFALRQFRDVLLVQLPGQTALRDAKSTRFYVTHFFSREKPVFVAISSGPSGTAVYADGVLVRTFPGFKFSSRDLTGQLIVGNSPASTHNWSGRLWGLAIYRRELSGAEISEQYATTTREGHPALAENNDAAAFYMFNEGTGSVIHNQADAATDLIIPDRFFVLNEQLLERPWSEFHTGWRYWVNVGINIAGFVPFGFFFCVYFSSAPERRWALAGTIALGFAVSLTIEVLQAFLPTRDSGMTDLITNTFGTALGAILGAWVSRQQWVAQSGVN
jgi:VanZ like family/Concanavalin A-like lectin/glucanases superfamily